MSSGKTIGLIKAVGGTGGGGGTSDAVQYIPQELTESQQMQARKNLNLYRKEVETVELLAETELKLTAAGGGMPLYMGTLPVDVTENAAVGDVFEIVIDGTRYTSKCVNQPSGNGVCIGNAGLFGAAEDSGEPFIILGTSLAYGSEATIESINISIFGSVSKAVPIPPEYLPDIGGVYDVKFTGNFVNGYTLVDQTFADIQDAYNSGKVLRAKIGSSMLGTLNGFYVNDHCEFLMVTAHPGDTQKYLFVSLSVSATDNSVTTSAKQVSVSDFSV